METKMKAILVMDMPSNCAHCDFSVWKKDCDWGAGDYCAINGGQCTNCKRPDLCPLKPMPKYKAFAETDEKAAYSKGWNECINELS